MYLKKCSKCGYVVNTETDKCSVCGKGFSNIKIIVVILMVVVGSLFYIELSNFTEEIANRKNIETEAETAKLNANYFDNNKASILQEINSLYEEGDYKNVVIKAKPYILSDDADLKNIFEKATRMERARQYQEYNKANRNKQIERQFSAWNGSHLMLEKFIKKNMNDPRSYKHIETVYWLMDDHMIVRTTFRGKNAFGAVVKNTVHATIDLDGNVIGINK